VAEAEGAALSKADGLPPNGPEAAEALPKAVCGWGRAPADGWPKVALPLPAPPLPPKGTEPPLPKGVGAAAAAAPWPPNGVADGRSKDV
jgi:hypothetical protein